VHYVTQWISVQKPGQRPDSAAARLNDVVVLTPLLKLTKHLSLGGSLLTKAKHDACSAKCQAACQNWEGFTRENPEPDGACGRHRGVCLAGGGVDQRRHAPLKARWASAMRAVSRCLGGAGERRHAGAGS
jgi:hypothetical protein